MPRLGLSLGLSAKTIVNLPATPLYNFIYKVSNVSGNPNLNNLRFYDTGSVSNGFPVYWDETNTYDLRYISMTWFISNRITSATGYAKFSGDTPIGNYSGVNSFLGNMSLVSI